LGELENRRALPQCAMSSTQARAIEGTAGADGGATTGSGGT